MSTLSITNQTTKTKPLALSVRVAEVKTCQFCGNPSESDTIPPLCRLHFDWIVLLNYMARTNTIISPASLKETLEKMNLSFAQQNVPSEFTITPADIDVLYFTFFPNPWLISIPEAA